MLLISCIFFLLFPGLEPRDSYHTRFSSLISFLTFSPVYFSPEETHALSYNPPLSLELSERSFPFYIPLTGALKSNKKNTNFERREKQEKFPLLRTPYWCTQKCQIKHHLWEASKANPEKVLPSLSSEGREISLSTYPLLLHTNVIKNHHFSEASGAGSYKWLWPFIYLLHFSNQFETLHSFAKIFIILQLT